MYSEEDFSGISRKLLTRRLIVYITGGLILCAAVISIVLAVKDWGGSMHRDENGEEIANELLTHVKLYPLSFILPLLAGFVFIFGMGVFIAPVRRYRDYVSLALNGRTRSLPCIFKECESTHVLREGVWVLPVTVSAKDIKNEADDRQLYFDELADLPDWKQGDRLLLTTHDKFIVGYEQPQEETV